MAAYDAEILKKYATQLYNKADVLVALYAISGGLIGAIAGAVVGAVASRGQGGDAPIGMATVGAVLLGALFSIVGIRKAFMLRLEAQRTLCQVQIEENTRARAAARTG